MQFSAAIPTRRLLGIFSLELYVENKHDATFNLLRQHECRLVNLGRHLLLHH